MTKKPARKNHGNTMIVLMVVLLLIGSAGFVLFGSARLFTPQAASDYPPGKFPAYLEVPDHGDVVANKRACYDAFAAWAAEYNAAHPFRHMRWTGDVVLTCTNGTCMCE